MFIMLDKTSDSRPGSRLRTGLFLGGLVLVASLGWGAADLAAAPAGYVYYFRTFGQWTVICGRDNAGGGETGNCTLSAPPPEIHGADSQIEIGQGPSGQPAVTMRVRGTLMPDSPFYLRVDAREPHQTIPNRFGEGGWSGAEAQRIIDELKAGEQVVVRWFVGPPPSPRDEMLSLSSFDDAAADLDERISAELSQRMPPPGPASAAPAVGTATTEQPPQAVAGSPEPATESPPAAPEPAGATAAPTSMAGAGAADAPTSGSTAEGPVAILSDHIGRARLTSNIVNREPVDSLTSPIPVTEDGLDAIYFFTEVVDFAGRSVTHRWEYEGSVAATVSFPIGGARWRVYSRKSVSPGQTGPWTVTATAPDGTVLSRATFVLK